MTHGSAPRRRLPGRLVALLVLAAVLLASLSASSPVRGQDGGTPPALAVSASASATTVPVGEAVTLSAQITGAPEGAPSYKWEMDLGGGWFTFSTNATGSYLTSGVETVPFRVTVSYGSGASATSDAVTVAFVASTQARQASTPPEQEQESEAETEVEKPAKPTGLSVTTVPGWLGALVDWDDVEGADDYLVRWRPAGPEQQLNDGLELTSSNTAITVDEDGEYVVRVQACNEAGCGAAVAERFTVAPLPPAPPESFTLTAADSGFEVTASWDAHDEATSYQLTWVSLEGTGLAGGSQEVTETSATVELAGSGEWQFHLQACNEGGCGATLVETVDVANATDASTSITGPSTPRISFLTAASGSGGAANMNTHDHALKFTTGPDSYRLTRVFLWFDAKGTSAPTYSLKVCTGTDTNPANDCSTGTLVNPDLQGFGFFLTFTTSGNGISLSANTSYYLVLDTTAAGTGTYSIAQTGVEDHSLGAPGWSFASSSLRKAQASGSTWGTDPNGHVWRVTLAGHIKASGAPTLEGLEVSGTTLIASFDRDLDASTASAIGHGIKIGSGALQAVTAIHVSGKWLVLTVPAVTQGQTVTATYTKPTSGNKLKDRDGNEVAGFSDQAVTNHTGTTPSLNSAVFDGRAIWLTYDRSLNQSSTPDRAQFKYKRDGGAALNVAGPPIVNGSQLYVVTSDANRPKAEQTATVSYTLPTTSKLQDAWGNDVPALTDQVVENRAPLVTNFGTTTADRAADAKFNRDQAQSFTTGSHSAGYTLTSVELRLEAGTGSAAPNYTVSIHSANADGTPGSTNHGTLTNPSKLAVGINTFTAPAGGIELKPNTTYFVVVDLSNDGDKFTYETTAANNEGGSPGWSIGNDRRFKVYNQPTWKRNTNKLLMSIHADYRAAPPADLTAPPEEVLVGNATVSGSGTGRNIHTATFDMAQAFTAGTHTHGYVLTSVKMYFQGAGVATPPTFNVKVCTGSDSNPISTCDSNHALTLSGTLNAGTSSTFTHSGGGIDLTKGTTYYVVLTTTAAGTGSTAMNTISDDTEDFQEFGWSISNGLLAKGHTETTWGQQTDSWRIQVLGRAKESGAPTVESLEIDGTTLVATFDRALDASAAPNTGSFRIKIGSGTTLSASAVSVSGRRVVLTAQSAATSGQTVTVLYAKPGSGNKLQDRDGNEVDGFGAQTVTNLTGTSVSLTSAEVDGNRMTLTFDRSLKLDSGTNPVAFEYKVGSGNWVSARVDSMVISGNQVTYQLRNHQIPRRDQTVLVRYAQPANNKLKDAWDNDAPAVSSVTATNISPLVSNARQTQPASRSSESSMGSDQAQFFTTGSNSDGYTLTSVDLWLRGEGGSNEPNFTVTIRAADADSKPTGASLGTLTKPSTLGVGLNTFTAPAGGINLKANTTYVVFVDSTTTPTGLADYPLSFAVTSSDNEDGGASTGWSVGNARWARPSGDTSYPAIPSGSTLRMVIRGEFGQNAGSGTPTARKLVGNIVASASFADGASRDVRTTFTTGTQSATLTRADVTVNTLGTPPTTYALELWSTGSGAARLATFTPPAALAAGLNTFTLTTAQTLAASTTYALVWDQGVASSTFRLGRAGNHHEDSDGLTGWSITNGASRRAHDSTAAFGSPSGGATRFALYGQTGSGGPAAPTGLRATPGDAQVVLNWADPSNTAITKYQVRQSTDGGTTWGTWTDFTSSATTTSHTVTSLTNATTYTFGLRAVAGTLNGASASVSATPAGQLVKNLNKPQTGSTPTSIVTDDATQSFTTGSNDLGYILSYVVLGMGVDSGATEPTDYSVKVCNNDSSGSNDVPGSTCTDLVEPAALAGGGADVFTAPGAGIVLSASTKYWIVFDSVSGGSGQVTVRRTTDTGEDTGAAAGWAIGDNSATRTRNLSTWTVGNHPQKIGIYGYARTGPAAPAGLSAQAGNRQVTLSWTNPNNAEISGYQYRQSTDGGTNWSPDWTNIPGSDASTTSYTVGSLSNGQAYTFQVRAVADQGATPGSASASVSATPVGPPAVPTGLRATPGDGQIKLTWTDPGNAQITQYQIRSHISGGPWGPWSIVGGSDATTTSDTLSGLTNGKTYSVQIRAVAGSVNGPPSAIVRATPAAALVKNLNKNIGGAAGTNIVANDAAQGFVTGSNGPGYTLNYVVLGAGGSGTPPGPDGYSVKLCNNVVLTGLPGTDCTDLNEPAALAGGGADVFAASVDGITLSAATKYWIVFDSVSGGSGTWELRRTTDDGQASVATAFLSSAGTGAADCESSCRATR